MQKALKRARKGSYNKSRYKHLKGSRKSILRIPVKLLSNTMPIALKRAKKNYFKNPH